MLKVIVEKTKKNSMRHTLISADDAEQWEVAEVSLAEIEMRQYMEQMVDNEMEKIKIKQEFSEELERRMADPQFCIDLNAEKWDYYEVAYWVNKNGYDYSMKRFFDQQIDGNVLLYDVNTKMLINQLGITQLHSNKFMRNLNELKEKIFKQKNQRFMLDFNVYDISIQSETNLYQQKIINLENEHKNKIHEMESKLIETNSNHKSFETKSTEKFLKSQQEIVELNSKINGLKESLNSIKNININ